jgi:sodium transport system permease protein
MIWTVLAKELRETLRDRRTLFIMIVIPVLLYPGC